ncbi:Protein kinase domain-containing protein, related [Eimeria mitis]|uniref:Protein kinase domain-containing protein, related n=1 Tax=Eimeria mitis TaxID=44415 RepID=U6K1M3_9EIME|nr:Protein kinase domain-containing protein, related [Eimeria mitis]CDJ29678.1 Protein kinase domain-containing protein, related [Eimeria mitis]
MLAPRTSANSSPYSSSGLPSLSYETPKGVSQHSPLNINEWQIPWLEEGKALSARRENRLYASRFLAVLLCSFLAALAIQMGRHGPPRAPVAKDSPEVSALTPEGKALPAGEVADSPAKAPQAKLKEDSDISDLGSPSEGSKDSEEQNIVTEIVYIDSLTPEGPKEPDSPFKKRESRFLGLPDMDGAEAAMPEAALRGKRFLASSVGGEESDDEQEKEDEEEAAIEEEGAADPAWAAVAKAVSHGEREKLIGASVSLTSIQPVDASLPSGASERTLKITRVLGRGISSLVVEAIDEQTQEKFALRLQVLEKLSLPLAETEKKMQTEVAGEMQCIRTAVEGVGAARAATKRGLAVPLYTATIAGAPALTTCGDLYVSSSVQLMERLHGSVQDIIQKLWRIPAEAKLYIARRLLLQVLHLQAAGISHNDIRLANCFMLPDGSFLLGDFGASAPFGCKMRELSRVPIAYAEPQLLVDLYRFLNFNGPSAVASATDDLWSLGIVLFELFADGKLPFGLAGLRNDFAAMQSFAEDLLKGEYDAEAALAKVSAELQKAQVPESWIQLICTLLEPRRSRRPSWAAVAESFPDLFQVAAG